MMLCECCEVEAWTCVNAHICPYIYAELLAEVSE